LLLHLVYINQQQISHVYLVGIASVFGEQRRLEPMPAERRARWRKEIDWLLSVTDYVVEFAPSQQKNKDGTNMEVVYLLLLLHYISFGNIQ